MRGDAGLAALVASGTTAEDLEAAGGDWKALRSSASDDKEEWQGVIGCGDLSPDQLGINLQPLIDPLYLYAGPGKHNW